MIAAVAADDAAVAAVVGKSLPTYHLKGSGGKQDISPVPAFFFNPDLHIRNTLVKG